MRASTSRRSALNSGDVVTSMAHGHLLPLARPCVCLGARHSRWARRETVLPKFICNRCRTTGRSPVLWMSNRERHHMAATIPIEKPVPSAENRLAMYLAPIAALGYPLTLNAFNAAVTAFETGPAPALAAAIAVFALALSFGLPALIVVIALRFATIEKPTIGELRARQVAFLAVAAPTLFVFIGVLLSMAGNPIPDMLIWVVFWLATILFIMRSASQVQVPIAAAAAAPHLRVAHGMSALAIILIFLGMHIPNHLVGLIGP